MIEDKRSIEIESSREEIFDLIEKMPNKFPVYKLLEKKPFLFVRAMLVDGFDMAKKAMKVDLPTDTLVLKVGDAMGPFELRELDRPTRYWFTLKSFFFNCRTGYSLRNKGNTTTLNLDLIAEEPTAAEKFWWFFVKPVHIVLANKVLKTIKKKVEMR